MAVWPETSHRMSGSFHRTAVNPSFSPEKHFVTLCHTSPASFSHLFRLPSPATSPRTLFSFEFGDSPEGLRLSKSSPASDPTQYSDSTSTITAKTPNGTRVSHRTLSTEPHPGAFSSLASLAESPQSLATCAMPHQQVNRSSTEPASPINGYTAAVTTTRPHTAAPLIVAATPTGDLIDVERTSSVPPPKTSPEFLRAQQSYDTASATAAHPPANGWEAAPDSGCQDREACHPFAHIVPSGLRGSFSLQGRTLLSPPAAGSPSLVEEAETRAGLPLDSPLLTRMSLPSSGHSYNQHDPNDRCCCAFTSPLREAPRPPSPAIYTRPYNSSRLPSFVSLLPESPDIWPSPSRCLSGSQVCRLSTDDVRPAEPEARESAEAITENHSISSGDLEILTDKRRIVKDEVQEAVRPTGRESTKSAGYTEIHLEGFTDKNSKEPISPSIFFTSCEEVHGKDKKKSTDVVHSSPLRPKESSKVCTSSLDMSCQQSMPGTCPCPRGRDRKKRRRRTSPTLSLGRTSAFVESSLQNELQYHVPATVTATCADACSEPRLAVRLNSASAAPLSASPAACSIGSGNSTDDAISSAGDYVAVNRNVAPTGVSGALEMFSASSGAGASGALGTATTMLSAAFNRNNVSTVAEGVQVASPAFIRGTTFAPVDEPLGMSASRALRGFDFPFCPGAANEYTPFSSGAFGCVKHGNTTISGSVTPASDSALHGAAASSSLPPGAIAYALAVKLFGFIPTPGFLPDPNPFDDPDHYLTKNLNRVTIKNSLSRKALGVGITPALPYPQVPAGLTGKFVPAGRALMYTQAAAEPRLLETGNMSSHTRQRFNPSTQRGEMRTNFLAANHEYMQPQCLGHMRLVEAENSTAGKMLYTLTVPCATATTSPVYSESPALAAYHVPSRTVATSTLRTSEHADSTRFSHPPATVDTCRPSGFSTSRDKAHVGPTGTEGWYMQSETHPSAVNLAKEIDYKTENGCTEQGEALPAEYQTQEASLVGQRLHADAVETCAFRIASMNGSSLTFEKNETGGRYYTGDGSNGTACEVPHASDSGRLVLNDGRRLHTAQVTLQEGPKTISFTDEGPLVDCVTGSYGIGGKVIHNGRFDVRPDSSYGRGSGPAGKPTQNSSHAADLRYRESSIYMPTYFHGNDSLYPSLGSHDDEAFSESSVEYMDGSNAVAPPNAELMAVSAGTRQVYNSFLNHPPYPGFAFHQGEMSDRASPDSSINGEAAGMAVSYIGNFQ